MEYLECLVTNYDIRPVHDMKNSDLMVLIQILVTGLHISLEK